MYRVVLVDDEPLVLDTFANYVDWASMSAKVVGTARNGREALQKVSELRPDILITDIKMPVSDGISLAAAVHEQFPEIQIVFLSGYNEFDYARSAIYLGVSAYLLKPLDHQELAETMRQVCARCEMEKNRRNASLPMADEYLRELLQVGGLLLPGLADEVAGIFSRALGLPKENTSFTFTLISIDEYAAATESRIQPVLTVAEPPGIIWRPPLPACPVSVRGF